MNGIKRIIKRWFKYSLALVLHYSGHNRRVICRAGQYVVLMFHKLDDQHDVLHLSVESETLKQVADWSNQLGKVTSMTETLAEKTDYVKFCLTFDDGYKDNTKIPSVIPGVPAIVYVASGYIETDQKFWAERLQKCIAMTNAETLDLSMMNLGEEKIGSEAERKSLVRLINDNIKVFEPEKVNNIVSNIEEQCGFTHYDSNGFMTWEDIAELSRKGVDIGGHTHDHVISSRVSDEEFAKQLEISNEKIGAVIGKPVEHFAFPNGGEKDISENAHTIIKQAGNHSAVSTIEGINQFEDGHYKIKRFNMDDTRLRSPFGKLSFAMFTTLIANPMFYS